MYFLFIQNFRHIMRTRLVLVMLIFSFLFQFVGIKLFRSVTVHFQGVITTVGPNEGILIALLGSLFSGVFLAAVYGIWMIPYAHQGQRSLLTFTLPTSKWNFPVTYAFCMLALLVLQDAMLILSFGLNFGFEVFARPGFPLKELFFCLALETLAFEAFTFAFAVSSMAVGAIPTLFMGAITFFLLQVAGVLFRFNVGQSLEDRPAFFTRAKWVYEKLPPAGELVFDLRKSLAKPSLDGVHLALWGFWLVVFVLLFRYMIRYPSTARSAEG